MIAKSAFQPQRIFWRNLVGAYCIGLDEITPIVAVACADSGRESEAIREQTGIKIYGLEERTRLRYAPVAHQDDAAEERALAQVLTRLSRDEYAIASPVPSRVLDEFASETGIAAAVAPYAIAQWLSEKRNWFNGLAEMGLNRLPGEWLVLSQETYASCSRRFGAVFVAQRSRGVSGSGTAVVHSAGEFERAAQRMGDEPVWVAPFISGPSLVVHALALEGGTAVGYPSAQLVGISSCKAPPGTYCGNDFYAVRQMPCTLVLQAQEQTQRIGDWMRSLGFQGIFGIDFVCDLNSEKVYAVDLNPRWLGSTAIFTQAESIAGRIPLATLDLAVRLGALSEREGLTLGERCREPVDGCQIILYSGDRGWNEIQEGPQPGVFAMNGEQATYLRPGIRLSDCTTPGEFLVTTGVPGDGLRIQSGAHLMRIYSRFPVLSENGVGILPWAYNAIHELYASVKMVPIPEPS